MVPSMFLADSYLSVYYTIIVHTPTQVSYRHTHSSLMSITFAKLKRTQLTQHKLRKILEFPKTLTLEINFLSCNFLTVTY